MKALRYAWIPLLALVLSHAASAEQHEGGMSGHHPMMMDDAGRQEMMQKMQARQAKLDELVAAMEAAEGTARVDAIADVVKELVAQRRAMNEHMQQMHGRMMGSTPAGGEPEGKSGSEPGGHEH